MTRWEGERAPMPGWHSHAIRSRVIGAGLNALALSRAHRLARGRFAGQGAILALHRIVESQAAGFAPNRALGITPAALADLLGFLHRERINVVPLDALPIRLRQGGRRVVALTFDDGYRDNLMALPVLERFEAPFTIFATTGFLDRTARLWWIELEQTISKTENLAIDARPVRIDTTPRKQAAFRLLRERLRRCPNRDAGTMLDRLSPSRAEDAFALVDRLCLDWSELARLAAHPLATIGCHTVTHPSLATLSDDEARAEIVQSRSQLAERLGRPIRHLAYPYGALEDVGAREVSLAAELGFETAVTTRAGVIVAGDAERSTDLPRVPVDGRWPGVGALDAMMSGVPTAMADWLRGRSPR